MSHDNERVPSNDATDLPHLAGDTVAAIIAASAGATIAGPAGALTGAAAGPTVTAAMRNLVHRVQTRRVRRAGEALSLAATLSGLTEDELANRISVDEGLAELAARVLAFVQDLALPEKRRALAATLALAARADEESTGQLERAMVIATALASIDGLHLRVMAKLEPYRGFVPAPPEPNDMPSDPIGMTISQIDAAAGLFGLADPAVKHLTTVGIVEDVTNGLFIGAQHDHPVALTRLGRETLRVIET